MLEARSLTIVRGRRTVLSGVDVTLECGRALHLTGANGSGKTSLLRVLAGLATPRSGRVTRAGACAFVPEKVVLAGAMKPSEWLAAMRRLRGREPLDWAAVFDLDPDLLERSCGTFSKGMLQRIALLEALHSGVPVLLLDEPFAGLDPGGREWVGRALAARLEEGAAVLLTDHSGAAAEHVEMAGQLRVRERGLAHIVPAAARVTIAARGADGRRSEHSVAPAESDDVLRALLADGWHIEGVSRP